IYIVAQGEKRAYLGEQVYQYDALNYLVLPVPMPLEAEVIDASCEKPYFALRLVLDLALLGELLLEMDMPSAAGNETSMRGIYVAPMDGDLEDVLQRLMRCLQEEGEERSRVLGPLLIKEALYHLLRGPQGWQLHAFAQQHRHHHRIAQVLQLIQLSYEQTLEVSELADLANMSVSSLHHHFKAVTGLSPIQYIKTVRLHQARRLMLHDRKGISDAAFKVGYASPSQFSREYKRLFGLAPSEDRL
ncbi:MAG: AraC family transcriptional regulator, partial [Oceanospirillales bacterium]|nr:AraC family transcriptional regulator [Oceanospirillales bacterium]